MLGEREAVEIANKRAELRLRQLKAAAFRRKFVRVDQAEEALVRMANEIRTALDALPRRYAEILRPTDPASGEKLVEEMVSSVYDRLSQATESVSE